MSAPRHERAATWQQAAGIRDEWLRTGLACGPADHGLAEKAIIKLYDLLGRGRPDIIWCRSPREAQALVRHLPTLDDLHRWVTDPPGGTPPIASDLAMLVGRLRGQLDDRISTPRFDPPPPKRKKGSPWPDLPAEQAITFGVPFADIVRRHIHGQLFDMLAHGFYLPGRRLLGADPPVCWYGQQEAHWIAYYDVWRRTGLAAYGEALDTELDLWCDIATSSGWFWLDEDRCVISHQPVAPMTFADGWTITI